jgi:hypothetical protein
MPQPRKYASNAERQAAYRWRLKMKAADPADRWVEDKLHPSPIVTRVMAAERAARRAEGA